MKTYTLLDENKNFVRTLPSTVKSLDEAKAFVTRQFSSNGFINESKWHIVSNTTVEIKRQNTYKIIGIENYLCHPDHSENYSLIWEIKKDDGTVSHYINDEYDSTKHFFPWIDVDEILIDDEDFLRTCLRRFYKNDCKLPDDESYNDCTIRPLKLWAKQVINRDRNERL